MRCKTHTFSDSGIMIAPELGTKVETMSLCEIGAQLKLPINVTKGSVPLQCNTYLPQVFAI